MKIKSSRTVYKIIIGTVLATQFAAPSECPMQEVLLLKNISIHAVTPAGSITVEKEVDGKEGQRRITIAYADADEGIEI
jgi:hypothetical protein